MLKNSKLFKAFDKNWKSTVPFQTLLFLPQSSEERSQWPQEGHAFLLDGMSILAKQSLDGV